MKKIIVSLIAVAFLLTGCGKRKLNINYDTVYNNLKTEYKDFEKIDKETIEGTYGVDLSKFESYMVVMEEDAAVSKMYAIFKYGSNKEDALDEANYFVDQYKAAWDNGYFPSETALVKKGMTYEEDNYFIYVVNSDPDKVYDLITK